MGECARTRNAELSEFGSFVESLTQLVLTCGSDGSCDYLSRQWVAFTGIAEEDQLGEHWLGQLHPDDREKIEAKWCIARAGGETFEAELRIRRYDGVHRWFKMRAVPQIVEGCASRWFVTHSDIHELREAQEHAAQLSRRLNAQINEQTRALRAANQHLSSLTLQLQSAQRLTQVGSWEFHASTRQMNWSRELFRVFGLAPHSPALGYESLAMLFDAASWSELSLAIECSLSTGQGYELTLKSVRADGSMRTIVARAEVILGSDQTVETLVGTFQDVTAQLESVERVATLSERLQLATSAAHIGVWEWDLVSNHLVWDDVMHELYGTSPDSFDGAFEAWRSAVHPEDIQPAEELLAQTLEGKAEFRTTFRVVHPNGEVRNIRAEAALYRNEVGEISRMIGVNWDITEQRTAELALKKQEGDMRELNELLAHRSNEAEAASRAKSMFVANMSHEIRTPIGAITGVTYLLARTPLSVEQRDLLDTIESSTRSLLSMVNDVLDLAKIEAGQLTLEIAPFSLKDVLLDIASLMSGYAADKEIELIVDAQPDLPAHLLGDRVRLMQVLTNLLGNAVKFTDCGTVKLSIHGTPGENGAHQCLRFEVADSGPGMSPELVERLFTPFTQGQRSEQSRPAGTGLGLSIVKDLVGLMHGELGVSSEVSHGSTFWFEIPFELANSSEREGSNENLRLLIVDDHEAQRLALKNCVRGLGWDLEVASSGGEALALLEQADQKQAFDVIVVDWKMPGMDGLETLDAIRSKCGGIEQPVVLLATAHDMQTLRNQPKFELADAYIHKPVTASTLYDAIVQALAVRNGELPGAHEPESAQGSGRLDGMTVLVADDSEVNRFIARQILQLENAVVVEAADGKEAAERVLSASPMVDVVLMDVQMPKQDGVEATRTIREDSRFASLPIIALTAGALNTERERALDAGMTDYITKPYDPDAIIARVRAHVSRGQRLSQVAHPSVSRPESGCRWPQIDGIEVAEVRHRLGGNLELFYVLLGRLQSELLAASEGGLDWADVREARAFLHRLRGSAGNLGAGRLAFLAGEAEEALQSEDRDQRERVVAPLRDEIKRFCAAVSAVEPRAGQLSPAISTRSPRANWGGQRH